MARADLGPGHIIVETVWNEKELIKQVPGTRWDPVEKHWTTPLTWEHCIMLRGTFGDALTVTDALNEWAWPMSWEYAARREMRGLLEPEVRQRTDLYPFQEVGVEFLRRTRETLLGDEMGTGKTVQASAALTEIDEDGFPAIVICPNSVKRSWARHVKDWTTGTPYVVEGSAAVRDKIVRTAMEDALHAVVIINYESLRTMTRQAPYGSIRLRRCRVCDPKNGEEGVTPARCQVHPRSLNAIPWRTVIVDEAHKIKSPQAQQTRAVWAVAHQPSVRYRWAMTGTPVANHPGDLWSILHMISPKAYPTKTHYVDRYCLQSWNAMGGLDIVGLNPAAREEFFTLLDPRFRRMRKDVVLSQLPPKVRSQRWVEMLPKQRRMYDEFEDALVVMDERQRAIVAPNALVAHLRQMQLSSATIESSAQWMPVVNDEDWQPRIQMMEPSPKLDALEEILDEMEGKPLAVCAHHRQLINLAAARLDKRGDVSYALLTGGQSAYERDKALRDFQDGRVRVLLFTIAAGGVGLTMTAADTLVFLQRSWSMIDNKQAEDRVHRIGSEIHEAIHIIDIVTQDSVEEDQIQSLHDKLMRLEEITRDRIAAFASPDELNRLDMEEVKILGSQL